MTYDLYALRNHNHSSVANANGVSYPVKGAGIVELTLSLYLEHTVVVTALSNNILYVPQVIKQLNCLLLIYLSFFFVFFRKDYVSKGLWALLEIKRIIFGYSIIV